MQLFHWRSQALKNYGSGYIVAMAETVEEARKNVLALAQAEIVNRYCWLDPSDPDDKAEIEAKMAEFLADMQDEPSTDTVILIYGSE